MQQFFRISKRNLQMKQQLRHRVLLDLQRILEGHLDFQEELEAKVTLEWVRIKLR